MPAPRVNLPADLKSLTRDELRAVSEDVRASLIDSCSRTGGHIFAHCAQLIARQRFQVGGKIYTRCWHLRQVRDRVQGTHARAPRHPQLVRVIAHLAIISSVSVLSPARSSAAHASSISDVASSSARSTPSNIGYVLLRSSMSRPAVLPSAAVVDVASSTSSAI